MYDLIIVGAGNAGREVLSFVKDINKVKEMWNVLGFIADTGVDIKKLTNGDYDILDTIDNWLPSDNEVFTVAIADPKGREFVVEKLKKKGATFVNIIHPTATVSPYSKIGKGLILYPYATIGSNASIGDFVMIQKSDIPHDVVIDDFSTISSLCGILGNVTIGKRVFVGCHSVIVPHKRVGDDAYIGAGSVVINNVKAGVKVFGNPAKKMDFL